MSTIVGDWFRCHRNATAVSNDRPVAFGEAHCAKACGCGQGGDTIVFTTVRHPRERFLSAFQNLIDQTNPSLAFHVPYLRRWGWSSENSVQDQFEVFLDYVETSIERNPLFTDSHWRQQYITTGYDWLPNERVLRVENLWEDLTRLFADNGDAHFLDEFDPDIAFNRSSQKTFRPRPAEEERIRKLYERDYALFGYDYD